MTPEPTYGLGRDAEHAGRVARRLDGLVVVDDVGDLPTRSERHAERDHVLLREVVDDRPGVVLNHGLVENLVGEISTDADDELVALVGDGLRRAGAGRP